jgi:hypothetical protein
VISPGVPVSFTNKTDCQNITEILLKVMLKTIILTDLKEITEKLDHIYRYIKYTLYMVGN